MASTNQSGTINYKRLTNGKESQERVQYQEKPSLENIRQQKDFSFSSWKRVNAGYVDNDSMKTTNQAAFSQELLAQADPVEKTHFRVADKHSHYVEASVRYKLLSGNNNGKNQS